MLRKSIVNAFIVVLLLLFFVDALPEVSLTHRRLKEAIDPLLDVTGLWQESWRLFAPEPDKINVAITADLTYADGSTHRWRSPDWSGMSALERFLRFREMEFIDGIRMDSNNGAWPDYADYLARTVRHPEDPTLEPVRVVLTRHWEEIPMPVLGLQHPFGKTLELTQRTTFYTRDYRR